MLMIFISYTENSFHCGGFNISNMVLHTMYRYLSICSQSQWFFLCCYSREAAKWKVAWMCEWKHLNYQRTKVNLTISNRSFSTFTQKLHRATHLSRYLLVHLYMNIMTHTEHTRWERASHVQFSKMYDVHTSDPHIDAGWVKTIAFIYEYSTLKFFRWIVIVVACEPQAAVTQRWTISYLLPITDYLGQRNGERKPQRERFARFAKNHVESILGACTKVWSQTISILASLILSLPILSFLVLLLLTQFRAFVLFCAYNAMTVCMNTKWQCTSRRWANREWQWHSNIEPYCHHFLQYWHLICIYIPYICIIIIIAPEYALWLPNAIADT